MFSVFTMQCKGRCRRQANAEGDTGNPPTKYCCGVEMKIVRTTAKVAKGDHIAEAMRKSKKKGAKLMKRKTLDKQRRRDSDENVRSMCEGAKQ